MISKKMVTALYLLLYYWFFWGLRLGGLVMVRLIMVMMVWWLRRQWLFMLFAWFLTKFMATLMPLLCPVFATRARFRHYPN